MDIVVSKQDVAKKLVYSVDNVHYYSVAYLNCNNEEGKYITICVSSQIGCNRSCLFCATGNFRHIVNLTKEICDEILDALNAMNKEIKHNEIQTIHIIFEGMGEVAYNFDECRKGFDLAWQKRLKNFNEIVVRISTVGVEGFTEKYKQFIMNSCYHNVRYQIKLSLHSPFEYEREYLLACKESRSINEIIEEYLQLSTICKYPLICNYILFQFPNGKNNYDITHLNEVIKKIKGRQVIFLLGSYSETGRGFFSPDINVFRVWENALKDVGVEVYITHLKAADINAACGMLHYEN